jgi:hypothetical protein
LRTITARLATTHVDLQRDKLTVGALRDMAHQVSESYLPMTLEHDIRQPPVGRVVRADVVELPDGEHALEAVLELFEDGDSLEDLAGDGRRMCVRHQSPQRFAVYYDRPFVRPDDRRFLDNLWSLAPADARPAEYVKKSLEPLPTLMILAGTFVLGSMATGFFQKLGEDAYEGLRDLLADHWRRRRGREELLDFCFCATHEGRPLEVHLLLSDPSAPQIERLFNSALKHLDRKVTSLPLENVDVAKIVLTYDGDALTVSYVVRGDCVPLRVIQPDETPSPPKGPETP